jgi:hypothetical protein
VLFGELTDASAILLDMMERITRAGLAWLEYLTPTKALEQIKVHGEDSHCEKIWIEDYDAFLNGHRGI